MVQAAAGSGLHDLPHLEALALVDLARGDTHKDIATILHRSPATVRNHIQSIYDKLEVSNVAGLIQELRLAG